MINNQTFHVRFAVLSDIEQLIDLQIEYESYFKQLGCAHYHLSKDERRDKLVEFAFSSAPTLQILVIEEQGKLVAYCTFYRLYIHEVPPVISYYVTSLYVKEYKRNSYLLFALFKKLIELARINKVEKIFSSVWGDNKPALSIYKRAGVKFCAAEDNEHFWYLDIKDIEKSKFFKRLPH